AAASQGFDQLRAASPADRLQPRRPHHRAHGGRGLDYGSQSRRQARSAAAGRGRRMRIGLPSLRLRLRAALSAGLCAAIVALAAPWATAAQVASLSPDEVATLSRVERYLNDIKTLQGRFVQVSSNGSYAEGEDYLDRPGQMRFDYDPPVPVLIIANDLSLLYYDAELKEATF